MLTRRESLLSMLLAPFVGWWKPEQREAPIWEFRCVATPVLCDTTMFGRPPLYYVAPRYECNVMLPKGYKLSAEEMQQIIDAAQGHVLTVKEA